jgi:hypothetical protein
VDKYCSRRPYRTPPLSGEDWVQKQVGRWGSMLWHV